jgi:hypothetical protein
VTAVCHAYNMQGQKCDLLYEHDDDHEFTIRWTNAECWTPDMSVVPATVVHIGTERTRDVTVNGGPSLRDLTPEMEEEIASMGPVPVYGESAPGKCIMCNHAMHARECERGGCDCRSGIPG